MSLQSKKIEKWKVEIVSFCGKTNTHSKSEHFSYLSKRFPNLNHYMNPKIKLNATKDSVQRATLFFYKSPLKLPKYKYCNVQCLSTITVREFNDRIFMSANGNSQSLLYQIFVELCNIELKNIRKIFIYGVLDEIKCKKFVGFAFRDSKHFEEITCKKRFLQK